MVASVVELCEFVVVGGCAWFDVDFSEYAAFFWWVVSVVLYCYFFADFLAYVDGWMQVFE